MSRNARCGLQAYAYAAKIANNQKPNTQGNLKLTNLNASPLRYASVILIPQAREKDLSINLTFTTHDHKCFVSLNMTRIAVTFALPAESSEFLRRLGNRSRADRNGLKVVHGTIEHRSIEVIHTGVGKNSCRQRIEKFLVGRQFDLLISAGFAGSLNRELQVNDLFVAKNFSTLDGKQAESSLSNVSIYAANMLTVPALIDSSEARERLARESGASAIDMETEFIAAACASHAIPLLALRVITDTPAQPFPAPPDVLFDIQQQRTNIPGLARFFLTNPKRIPGLVQFAQRIARARRTLTNGLVEIARTVEL